MSAFGAGGSTGPGPDNGPQSGSTSHFVIFALAVYTLVLVPYTLVKLRAAGKSEDDVDRPWEVRPWEWEAEGMPRCFLFIFFSSASERARPSAEAGDRGGRAWALDAAAAPGWHASVLGQP